MISLLDKYTETIKKMEFISNEIKIMQKITHKRIRREQNEDKKKEIYCEFLSQMESIKNNKDLKKKYNNLREKQRYLYNRIAEKMTKNDTDNQITIDYMTDTNNDSMMDNYKNTKHNNNIEITSENNNGDMMDKSNINKINDVISCILCKYKTDVKDKIKKSSKAHTPKKYLSDSSDEYQRKHKKTSGKRREKEHERKKQEHKKRDHERKKHERKKKSELVYVKSFATTSTIPSSKIKQQVINNTELESESIMTNTSEILKSRDNCATEDINLLTNVSKFLSDDNSKIKNPQKEINKINKSDEDQIKRLNNLIKSLKN